MYITETTGDVRNLFDKLEIMNDVEKIEMLMSIFNLINNNQINNKNDENPNLTEVNDMIIFNMESLGFTPNYCTIFLQYNLIIYNSLSNKNDLYEKDGNIIGFKYSKDQIDAISHFEKLSFNEKLDVIAEILIRYDNGTYIKNNILPISLHSEFNGFEIANMIKKYKI